MTEEARKARAEYLRAWRAAHPEKNKQYQAAFWERKAEQNKMDADSEPQNNSKDTPKTNSDNTE